MANLVAQLFSQIETDPWRKETGFSADLMDAHNEIISAAQSTNREKIAEVLGRWLQRFQPCLFGRVAAKLGLIEYCVLLEEDLQKSDEEIMEIIQKARTQWTREGYSGRRSAFIITAVSHKLATALPNSVVQELAKRLCFLYLRQDVQVDQIYVDELFLEIPGNNKTTWKWPTGVNYFSAQGDGRWWQDHRIPGGMAFSVNSVGHMVKAGRLAKGMNEVFQLVGAEEEGWTSSLVDSLEKSLDLAMRTIAGASNSVSGKATFLLPVSPIDQAKLPACPISLPKLLANKNHCEYAGFYHTDYTIPSEYFVHAVERPTSIKTHVLDFTYLFLNSIDNPDHQQMGSGIRIRSALPNTPSDNTSKALRGIPTPIQIDESPRLLDALRRD